MINNGATPKAKPVFFKAESKVETVSVEDKAKPYSETEKKTAKIEVTHEELAAKGDYEKSLEKFKELLRVLQDQFKFEIRFMKELWVPIRKKDKNNISQIEYYDWKKIYEGKKPNHRRKCLLVVGKFPEVNNLVAFLEVDQTGMGYSLSTFIFITKKQNINFEFLKESANYFLVKKLEGLRKEQFKKLMESKGIEVYFKKHPSTWNKRLIVNWCRKVKKIITKFI